MRRPARWALLALVALWLEPTGVPSLGLPRLHLPLLLIKSQQLQLPELVGPKQAVVCCHSKGLVVESAVRAVSALVQARQQVGRIQHRDAVRHSLGVLQRLPGIAQARIKQQAAMAAIGNAVVDDQLAHDVGRIGRAVRDDFADIDAAASAMHAVGRHRPIAADMAD